MTKSALFDPLQIKSLQLPNRIIMAPMGRLFATDGIPAPSYLEYYRRRAEGGTGLIIGEASGIMSNAAAHKTSPFFYGDAPLASWKAIAEAVRAAGSNFMPQLWHAGLARTAENSVNSHVPSVGPSGWYIPDTDSQLRRQPGRQHGEPMTQAQIDQVIQAFGDAAAAAKRIGCAGVEIHGAHGYLIDQFFWKDTNQRTDGYGGNIRNRARFGAEVVQEVRRRTGSDFPVFFRFSQWKIQDYNARVADTPQELEELLSPLVDAGVDVLHCSTRRFWEPAFTGSSLSLAGWAKKLTGLPVIAVGSVSLDTAFGIGKSDDAGYSPTKLSLSAASDSASVSQPISLDGLVTRLEQAEFDLVAVGRAMIANPDWAELVRSNRSNLLKPYDPQLLATLE